MEIVYTPKAYLGFESPSLRQRFFESACFGRFLFHRPFAADTYFGRVAERLNAAVSKTVLPVFPVTRVQIPPLPPGFKRVCLWQTLFRMRRNDAARASDGTSGFQSVGAARRPIPSSFKPAVLVSCPLADLLAHAPRLLTPFGRSANSLCSSPLAWRPPEPERAHPSPEGGRT